MNLRIIIAAAGNSSRWDNAYGVPKHLIPVNGEALIHRTQKQFDLQNQENQILLATNPQYKTGAFRWVDPGPPEKSLLPNTAIGHSFLYWAAHRGTSLLLFGDVYFTDSAKDIIIQRAKEAQDVVFIGRSGKSASKEYRELFGVIIPQCSIAKMEEGCRATVRWRRDNPGMTAGGWIVFLHIEGKKLAFAELEGDWVEASPHFLSVNDDTEDFDYPEDYEHWLSNRK